MKGSPSHKPPNVDFVYFDAGGGHRAAATALKQVIEEQQRPWNVRLVNLQELLEPMDVFKKATGIRLEEIYNKMLARGWTLGSFFGLRFMHGVIQVMHRPTRRMLAQHWLNSQPDLVVSVVPNFNRALYESLRLALPAVPFVTILTDFADYPPHFWMEPNQDQYLICGTAKAAAQARAIGYPPERILPTSGMILRPRFYEALNVDRDAERRRLGLDPARPTGLVLFGGQGSRVMRQIAERLPDTQLIFICGKNEALAESLRALPSRAPKFVEGFTQQVPYYMRLADFFIGKPGPGSISEAIAMKLPVIVERNAWTLIQERYNTEWVAENQVGLVVNNFNTIGRAVEELLAKLPAYRARAEQIENRAIFEIPPMLEQLLNSKARK